MIFCLAYGTGNPKCVGCWDWTEKGKAAYVAHCWAKANNEEEPGTAYVDMVHPSTKFMHQTEQQLEDMVEQAAKAR